MPSTAIQSKPFSLDGVPDFPQCTPKPIKIIHIGMGASGMLFAHKAEKFLQDYTLVCYEKNDQIGGTWYENRYPGCACDIPAHTYTFPWYPNANWSGYYSYGDEIQEYFLRFAREFGVEKYAIFNTEVTECRWVDDKWMVQLRRRDGSTFVDYCDILVNGTGILNKWKWPVIEGLHDFEGTLAHSANWPQDLDWRGKSVAVIGTGSSSIQMVPQFAESAKRVTVFMRNQTYIGPQIGSNVTNKDADENAIDPEAAGKHHYTQKEKQRFLDDPAYHLQYRRAIERSVVSGFRMFYRGSEANIEAKRIMQEAMAGKLGPGLEDVKERFIPNWSPGCRRLTPGEGYLESLALDHVRPTFEDIIKVTPKGILTKDGLEHKADIIACATGFDIQFLPHFKVVGVGGLVMQDSEPNVYASVASPGFPNYFIVNGPRGNWGQGCALPSHDVQIEYILQVCQKIQEDHIESVMPKADITTQMNLYMDTWHQKHSVWAEHCRSWYKDNKPDGRIYIWPGSLLHHLKYLKRPRFEHYDISYDDPNNIFMFLGNGLTRTEINHGVDDLPVPYIRNHEDEPWDIV